MRKTAFSIGLVLVHFVSAQSESPFDCGANELWRMGTKASTIPQLLDRIAEKNIELESFTWAFAASGERGGGATYVIPVVFHIVHNNGPENISDAQVIDAMRILNDDFNRLNADWDNVRSEFQGIVADVGVEFRLATQDPDGNCTNGITRTQSTLTNEGSSGMKELISWPRNKYLQVWVAAYAGGAAGYTFRPGSAQFFPNEDGIVLLHEYTGSVGTGSLSRSRTLTHEVGHWINLLHTWGDGNDPELDSNCSMDDNVADTPNTIGWTICNLSGISCGSLDNVENYMDYSYCSKMFTEGQAVRMIAALNSGVAQRNQIWQTSNLNDTGVNGNAPLCAAQFAISSGLICAGGTVEYTDQSYNNVSSWNWTFPGGTPSTSTEANPIIVYSGTGIFSASLTVGDGNGSLSTTSADVIVVASDPGQSAPLVEGFETAASFAGIGWTSLNTDGDAGFGISSAASFSGTKSARLSNSAGLVGRVDELISPTLDMSNASFITVSFKVAYARRSDTNNDVLRVFVSKDCGSTWSLRRQLYGSSNLATGGTVASSFIPNGPDQWSLQEITTIGSIFHTSSFRLRFEFESDGGNNLYLDDINITSGEQVGIEGLDGQAGVAMYVAPNPALSSAQAILSITDAGMTQVDLLDPLGRTITNLHNGNLMIGERRFDIPIMGLASGMYLLRCMQNGLTNVVRFTVE